MVGTGDGVRVPARWGQGAVVWRPWEVEWVVVKLLRGGQGWRPSGGGSLTARSSGGTAMAAAVARGRASRSSPRLLWASKRRRGAGHVGLGAGWAVAAALSRTQLAPSDRRSVACAGGAERQRRPGRGACSSGVVMARRSEAAAQRQQAQRARRAAARALRAQRGERRARERERRERK